MTDKNQEARDAMANVRQGMGVVRITEPERNQPDFNEAADRAINDHGELLSRLADGPHDHDHLESKPDIDIRTEAVEKIAQFYEDNGNHHNARLLRKLAADRDELHDACVETTENQRSMHTSLYSRIAALEAENAELRAGNLSEEGNP